MAASGKNAGVFRFGPFDFDPATRELRKHGTRLKAPDQSLAILAMLVAHPGQLVTREAIRARLWPHGTVVEFDHSVNSAVKRLRDVLSDSAGTPRYIETLPKMGYRFIAHVEESRELPAIPHYRVLEQLGRGGVVYRAEDIRLGRHVAIKMLPREIATDPQRRMRLLREARAASALNHPNIVTVYDVGCENGLDFLVMELIAGKPLGDLIPPMGLRIPEVVGFAIQIAGALARAHSAGIIHRDLKPCNIMVDVQGNAKLRDFGVANTAEAPPAQEDTAAGATGHMSPPEQAGGKPVDSRTDVFSFGAVLYEMVTGRRAFEPESSASGLAQTSQPDPTPPRQLRPDIPAELEHVILRCLAKNPGDSYPRMDEIVAALQGLRTSDPAGIPGSRRPIMRKSGLVLAGACLATISVASYYWSSQREHANPDLAGIPLTPSGVAFSPSFSPDGNRIAFTWDGDKGGNFDIYIRQIGSNALPLRITTDQAADIAPEWSPDDRYIAFVRQGRDSGEVFVISPLGGRERRIPGARVDADFFYDARPLSWTPDSKWLAVTVQPPDKQPSSVWLFPVESGEPRRLTSPPPGSEGDHYPRISPDGRTLAFARSLKEFVPSLWRLRLNRDFQPDGEPSALLDFRHSRLFGLAWTPDNHEVIYSAGDPPQSRLFRTAASRARGAIPLGAPAGAMFPAINDARRRLAYVQFRANSDFWRLDTRTGERKLLVRLGGVQQQYSPDGRRIAFVTTRSGHTAIWTCEADGTGCAELASLGNAVGGAPQWSPDSRWIAADSREEGQSEIYLIPADGGVSRRITTDPADDILPTWSCDGEWIYFGSNRSGRNEIWRTRSTGGGQAVQVTRSGGMIAFESADRRWLYYLRQVPRAPKLLGRPTCELLRMRLGGGKEELVLPSVQDFDEVAITADAIFFSSDLQSIQRLSPATGEITTVLNEPFRGSLSVSPDGAFILLAAGRDSSDLMLVEGFR